MHDDAEALIKRAQTGDREALSAVFELYRGRIQGLVRKKLGDPLRVNLDSSDVVQSVCLEAMKGIEKIEYTNEDGFVHWLARITENTIRDKHRYFGAQKRAGAHSLDLELDSRAAAGPAETPSGIVGHSEQMNLVMQALKKLPEDYRRVITLVRFEKKTHAEAAEAMSRTEKATRMLLARARLRLVEELKDVLETDA
ncbi:MAG: RNA polymerase sigma factor [Planctomycetota bacterium]